MRASQRAKRSELKTSKERPGISVWVFVSTLRKSEFTYLVTEKTSIVTLVGTSYEVGKKNILAFCALFTVMFCE